jgi:carbon storage regulator
MLVLTRHVDESIAIGDSIIVTVVAIEGDRIKLGIAAPREIPILRQEVFQAIREQEKIEEQLANSPEPDTFQQLRDLLSSSEHALPKEPDNPQS